MEKTAKIYIAGHTGLVGSAILRCLKKNGYDNIVVKTHSELDLTNQALVDAFFEKEKPDYVFLAAARVGGIVANNTYPAEFIYTNLMIGTNVINASYKNGVRKLLNLASSCIYPKDAPQPMKEEYLLEGGLEKTSEAYSIAKIAAIKLCHYYNTQYGTDFITVMPPNQYGTGDNFSMQTAHFLPMILRRFHLAKLLQNNDFDAIRKNLKKDSLGWGLDEKINFSDEKSLESACNAVGAYRDKVTAWGDGKVYRELMNSDDLAEICLTLMNTKSAKDIGEFLNVGVGEDIQMKALLELVAEITGFNGKVEFDASKPNGVYRKLLDNTKMKALGLTVVRSLKEGIMDFYNRYLAEERAGSFRVTKETER